MMNETIDYLQNTATSRRSSSSSSNTNNPFSSLKKKVIQTEHVSTRSLRPVFGHRTNVSRSTIRVKIENKKPTTMLLMPQDKLTPTTIAGSPFSFQPQSLSTSPIEKEAAGRPTGDQQQQAYRPIFGIRKEKSAATRSLESDEDDNCPRSLLLPTEEEEAPVVVSSSCGLPDYAWSLHDICTHAIQRRNLVLHVVYHAQIITWTVVTIVAAVVYGHSYVGYPPMELGWQLVTFVATIVLPLYSTFLILRRDHVMKQPFALPRALALLNREMYKFRTKTGLYKMDDSRDDDTVTFGRRKDVLTAQLQDLWDNTIRHDSTIRASGVLWTATTCSASSQQVEDETTAVVDKQHPCKLLLDILRMCPGVITVGNVFRSIQQGGQESKRNNNHKTTSVRGNIHHGSNPFRQNDQSSLLPVVHEPALETDYLLLAELPSMSFDSCNGSSQDGHDAEADGEPAKLTDNGVSKGKERTMDHVQEESGSVVNGERRGDDEKAAMEGKDDANSADKFIIDDDGYSDLSPEQYMNARIQAFHAQQSALVQRWQAIQDCSQGSIQLLTVGASVTALVSYQWAIPVVMAVAAALTNVLEIGDYNQSIVAASKVLQQLDDLQTRYKSTTATGARNSNKEENAEPWNENGDHDDNVLDDDDDDTLLTLPNEEAWDSLVEAAEAIILQAEF